MSLMRASRGGKDDDSRFHHRMRGQGPYAALIRARFEKAARRLGLTTGEGPPLDCTQFRPPSAAGQLSLW